MNYSDLKADDAAYKVSNPTATDKQTLAALQNYMLVETHTTRRIFDRDVYNALGAMEGEKVLEALEQQSVDVNDPYHKAYARVLVWIIPGPEKGVDICDSEVQDVLLNLVGKNGVTLPMINSVIALQNYQIPKYPNLRLSDLQYARGLS